MADGGLKVGTLDAPGNGPVNLEAGDDHIYLVLTQGEVLQRVAIHLHGESVADCRYRVAVSPHEHPRGVNRHVSGRTGQHFEDGPGRCTDRPLNTDLAFIHVQR